MQRTISMTNGSGKTPPGPELFQNCSRKSVPTRFHVNGKISEWNIYCAQGKNNEKLQMNHPPRCTLRYYLSPSNSRDKERESRGDCAFKIVFGEETRRIKRTFFIWQSIIFSRRGVPSRPLKRIDIWSKSSAKSHFVQHEPFFETAQKN